ncbi:MAG: PAS domain S-box protein, partial [Alphaproteobacteria bacterium]|nr:PAS domain S-box protein [Alphaproteobacteria bacterium]
MTDGDLHLAPFDETARDVLDSLPCGVISTLPDGVIVEVNTVFVAWTGQRREALAGRRFQDLLTISGQIFYEAQFAPSLRRPGVVREMTCQLKRVSREPLDILVNSTLKLDSNGAPSFIRTAIVEATDRVKYEEELHRTRTAAQQLAAIVTSSSDAVVSAGLDGAVLSWNPGATALFGYTEAEAVGSSVTELIVPKDLRAERLQKHQKLLAGETVFYKDTVRHRKDGSLVQVEITASPMRDAQGRVAAASLIVRDIHDQKAKNDALRKSEARYRALVDASTTAVWRANAEGVVTYATDLWKELTGQTNEEQLGWGWLNAIHPDDRNSTIARWNNSLETRTIHENEFRVRTVAGHYRWFGVRAVPMFNLDGSVEGWVGANTDIHDEKTAKEAMRLSEVRYRRLFEAAHDGVLILDPDTRKITDANPFMTKLIGYAHDQLIGKELFEIGFFSDAQASRDMFQTLKATREIRYENLPLQSQDGNLREVEVVANLYDEDGRAVIQC